MKWKFMALSAIVASLVVVGCGSDDQAANAGGNGTDRAFVAAMIPHHESAVEMAELAQERASSEFVKTLASNIIRTQTAEIGQLRDEDARLADAGVKAGDLDLREHMMKTSDDMRELETAKAFDRTFAEMMITHHESAIEMAKIELKDGSDGALKGLAQDIIDAQEKEIADMKDFLGDADSGDSMGHSG